MATCQPTAHNQIDISQLELAPLYQFKQVERVLLTHPVPCFFCVAISDFSNHWNPSRALFLLAVA
ncbi:hypothetical protein B565_1757 [Aeromonas veronii B565]|nr:hypothetical protein B565_1757 [Aeromonas veronii B565]